MRALYKALFEEVKAHNASRDYLAHYNKGIELITVSPIPGAIGLAFYVYCTFETEWEEDNNVVRYKVHVYPDGITAVYYDSEAYFYPFEIESWKKAV